MVNVSRSLTNINSVFASPHKDYGGSCRTSLIGGLCFRIVLNNLFIKMMEIQNIQSKLVQKRFFEYRIRGQAEGMYTLRTFLGIQSLSSVHMFDMTADAYRYEKLILYVDNGESQKLLFTRLNTHATDLMVLNSVYIYISTIAVHIADRMHMVVCIVF